MSIQDTTTDHHCQAGPWAQEERGLLPGAGQECQEPPDWLPGRPRPHHHHLKLILLYASTTASKSFFDYYALRYDDSDD